MSFHARSLAVRHVGCFVAMITLIGGFCQPGSTPDQTPHGNPAAIVDGSPIGAADLMPTLAELAGSVALEEAAIDRVLAVKERSGALKLAPEAEETELRALLTSMAEEARVGPEEAARLLSDLRVTRGLGPTRFRALLRRNAGLRAMVSGTVQPAPEDIHLAEEAEFGPRYRVRLITSPDRSGIAAIADRVRRAPTGTAWVVFAEEAVLRSNHPTASRGGLLPEVSAADFSLPAAVRSALGASPQGTVSDVLVTPDGYALVLVERVTPGNPSPTPDQKRTVAAKLQRRLERLAMDRAAREMLDAARVTVFDASLRWSWENRPR